MMKNKLIKELKLIEEKVLRIKHFLEVNLLMMMLIVETVFILELVQRMQVSQEILNSKIFIVIA